MKEEFLMMIAQMGVADCIYYNKKEKWVYSWMNKQEQEVYNLGWVYAKSNTG